MLKPQTLKGFRDFLPREARKRQYVIKKLKEIFELYGFEPLETPTLEYEELLTGKYGDEGEKLMYRFEDHGNRRVAMRYDQTVPTARVIGQYHNELPMPFKRYQIQTVWRAENTQKGRFREFLQCDADIMGTTSIIADAEIINVFAQGYKALGFQQIKILVNDRKIFEGLPAKAITIIDKLGKIGEDRVVEELVANSIVKDANEAKNVLQSIIDQPPTEYLSQILAMTEKLGLEKNRIVFSPTLARGLDYYTGVIFEAETPEYPYGSLGGGGRYDNLIGMFANKQIPAVGFAYGFDRTMEAMDVSNLFPDEIIQSSTKILVTIFSPELQEKSFEIISQLRYKKINADLYLDANAKLDKQLKYADQKGIPYAIIIGSEEVEKNIVTVKDLKKHEQKQMTIDELLHFLQSK